MRTVISLALTLIVGVLLAAFPINVHAQNTGYGFSYGATPISVPVATATTTPLAPVSASSLQRTWVSYLTVVSSVTQTVTIFQSLSITCNNPINSAAYAVLPGFTPIYAWFFPVPPNTYLCGTTSASGQTTFTGAYQQAL